MGTWKVGSIHSSGNDEGDSKEWRNDSVLMYNLQKKIMNLKYLNYFIKNNMESSSAKGMIFGGQLAS